MTYGIPHPVRDQQLACLTAAPTAGGQPGAHRAAQHSTTADFRQTGGRVAIIGRRHAAQGVRRLLAIGHIRWGRFGVGLDAMGLLGIKLDYSSDPQRHRLAQARPKKRQSGKDDPVSWAWTRKNCVLDNHDTAVGTLLPHLALAM